MRSPRRKLALATVAAFMAVALFADFIASDGPIASSIDGERSWFGNVHRGGDALRGGELSARLGPDDWALWAPIRFDPISVRTRGELVVLAAPSRVHWLGTDDRGRDVMARLVHGARSTLILAASVAACALAVGILLGLLAAGARRLERPITVAADLGSGLPAILLVVAAQGLWGSGSLALTIAVLSVPRIADASRITAHGLVRSLEQPYAEAARALGVTRLRLLVRHGLPNVMPQLWVATALTGALVVLAEAALSFLGFGTPPPQPSWGELLAQAHQNGLTWWLLFPAGACAAGLASALAALASRPKVTRPKVTRRK